MVYTDGIRYLQAKPLAWRCDARAIVNGSVCYAGKAEAVPLLLAAQSVLVKPTS